MHGPITHICKTSSYTVKFHNAFVNMYIYFLFPRKLQPVLFHTSVLCCKRLEPYRGSRSATLWFFLHVKVLRWWCSVSKRDCKTPKIPWKDWSFDGILKRSYSPVLDSSHNYGCTVANEWGRCYTSRAGALHRVLGVRQQVAVEGPAEGEDVQGLTTLLRCPGAHWPAGLQHPSLRAAVGHEHPTHQPAQGLETR